MVRIVKDLDADLVGRHVLVVEDIIDTGLTLNYLRRYLQARNPASVEICALLVKEGEQRVELDLRYVGFTIPASSWSATASMWGSAIATSSCPASTWAARSGRTRATRP